MWAFQQEAQAAELARPPVSDMELTACLLDEYEAHPNFRAHVQVCAGPRPCTRALSDLGTAARGGPRVHGHAAVPARRQLLLPRVRPGVPPGPAPARGHGPFCVDAGCVRVGRGEGLPLLCADAAARVPAAALHAEHKVLVARYYSPMVFEDMMDVFLEAADAAAQSPDEAGLLAVFQDPIRSDWCVCGRVGVSA